MIILLTLALVVLSVNGARIIGNDPKTWSIDPECESCKNFIGLIQDVVKSEEPTILTAVCAKLENPAQCNVIIQYVIDAFEGEDPAVCCSHIDLCPK